MIEIPEKKHLKKRKSKINRKTKAKKIKYIFLIMFVSIILFLLYKITFSIILLKKSKNTANINSNINKNSKGNSYNSTKICVCTPAKEENRYIREFVQHYERNGVDKMFIYDNNDITGEKIEDELKDYISKGFVEVLNWRGKKKCMYKIMNDCYRNNFRTYDWFIFYEADEFIHLNNYTNIKDFLNEDKFNKCEIIHLNEIPHTDNNQLYYENKPLAERFPELTPKDRLGGYRLAIKSIIRGKLPYVKITNIHRGDENLKKCNGYGGPKKTYNVVFATEKDYTNYYIDHYYSKSTEELIQKAKRGDLIHQNKYDIFRIKKYFTQSVITPEKLDLIEQRTGYKFPELRNKTILDNLPFFQP